MNQKRKIRLFVLFLLLAALSGAFWMLKGDRESGLKESNEEAVSHSVIEIDPEMVREIGIINGDETINLTRTEDGWKVLEDESVPINSDAVERFLEKAASISSDTRIEDAADLSQYGLESPAVNITLQWDDNMYIIRLGDYNSMISSYYLRINDESTVYTVDSVLYYSLNKTLEDFKELEEE